MNTTLSPDQTHRKEAMSWWHKLRQTAKVTLTRKCFPGRNYFMLTGKEIQSMWPNEDKAA